MAQPGRPRTPLRRVSQGSLSALARSHTQLPGSTGLEFLEPAFVELADECELLIGNMDGLNKLSDSLDAFNEGFASYLFVLKMNTLCVEWPEAPTPQSFRDRMEELERAQRHLKEALPSPPTPPKSETTFAEPSYAVPSAPPKEPSPPPASATARQAVKPSHKKGSAKLTAKEKKARDVWLEKLINLCPMEYRGRDAALRTAAESVLNRLIGATGAVRPADLVKLPDLPPFMVNKCLITFVNAKVVQKIQSNGVALYSLSDIAYSHQH